MTRYRLRTLLIVLALGPPVLACFGLLLFRLAYVWYAILTSPAPFKNLQD